MDSSLHTVPISPTDQLGETSQLMEQPLSRSPSPVQELLVESGEAAEHWDEQGGGGGGFDSPRSLSPDPQGAPFAHADTAANNYYEYQTQATIQNVGISSALLPSQPIPTRYNLFVPFRKYTDVPFSIIYRLCATIYVVIGIAALIFAAIKGENSHKEATLFWALKNSLGVISGSMTIALFIGSIWFYLLRKYVRVLIWVTIIATPCISMFIFGWMLTQSISVDHTEDGRKYQLKSGFLFFSLLPLLSGILNILYIYRRYRQIEKTITTVLLACQILEENPKIFDVALFLLAIYVVFLVSWLIFFSSITKIGHLLPNHDWIPEPVMYYLSAYYVFFLLWTTGIFSNILRVGIAGVVSQWYFHRHDPLTPQIEDPVDISFERAVTSLFGSVCIGGLILSMTQTIHQAASFLKQILRNRDGYLFGVLLDLVRFLDGILENLNNFAMSHVGLTGTGFWSSALTAARLLKRNFLYTVPPVILIRYVLWLGSFVLAIGAGFGASLYAVYVLHTPYLYLIGSVGAVVFYFILQFFAHILTNTVDATLLCYAIDRDSDRDHCTLAKEAFDG